MGSSKPYSGKAGADDGAAAKPGARCPICTGPADAAFRPFCSRRCADVDLSRWLRGAYAISGRADTDEDGDDSAAATGLVRNTDDAPRRDEEE